MMSEQSPWYQASKRTIEDNAGRDKEGIYDLGRWRMFERRKSARRAHRRARQTNERQHKRIAGRRCSYQPPVSFTNRKDRIERTSRTSPCTPPPNRTRIHRLPHRTNRRPIPIPTPTSIPSRIRIPPIIMPIRRRRMMMRAHAKRPAARSRPPIPVFASPTGHAAAVSSTGCCAPAARACARAGGGEGIGDAHPPLCVPTLAFSRRHFDVAVAFTVGVGVVSPIGTSPRRRRPRVGICTIKRW